MSAVQVPCDGHGTCVFCLLGQNSTLHQVFSMFFLLLQGFRGLGFRVQGEGFRLRVMSSLFLARCKAHVMHVYDDSALTLGPQDAPCRQNGQKVEG